MPEPDATGATALHVENVSPFDDRGDTTEGRIFNFTPFKHASSPVIALMYLVADNASILTKSFPASAYSSGTAVLPWTRDRCSSRTRWRCLGGCPPLECDLVTRFFVPRGHGRPLVDNNCERQGYEYIEPGSAKGWLGSQL